jgi:hypothetical protein
VYGYSFILTNHDVSTPARAAAVEDWYRHRTEIENREHLPPLRTVADVSNPAAFAVIAPQHLGHRQGDQLAVGEQRCPATTSASLYHVIVDQHVQCAQEGVQVSSHILILNALRPHPR